MRIAFPVLVAAAITLTAGCAARSRPAANFAQQYAGQTTIRLVNESSRTICYVQFSPAHERTWGADWLGSSETIEPGKSRAFGVLPSVYDIRVLDCSRNVIATMTQIDLSEPRDVIVQ